MKIPSLEDKRALFDFVYLFLIVLSFNIGFLILKYYIFNKPIFDENEMSYLKIGTFISFVLVIPLLEEFCFRGIFMIPKKTIFIYPTLICIIVFILIFLKLDFKSIILITIISILGILYVINIANVRGNFNFFIENHHTILIIVSAIIFSIIHITNYESRDLETYLKLIPRLTGGLYLGYIAYKYGISKSYLMHVLNNLLPFIYLFVMRFILK